MQAGKLRHLVDIQRAITGRDAHGGETKTWVTDGQCYVEIKPLNAREIITADSTDSRVTHQIITRFYQGLNAKRRIKYGDRIFNISGIRNIEERRKMMIIDAIEQDIDTV